MCLIILFADSSASAAEPDVQSSAGLVSSETATAEESCNDAEEEEVVPEKLADDDERKEKWYRRAFFTVFPKLRRGWSVMLFVRGGLYYFGLWCVCTVLPVAPIGIQGNFGGFGVGKHYWCSVHIAKRHCVYTVSLSLYLVPFPSYFLNTASLSVSY